MGHDAYFTIRISTDLLSKVDRQARLRQSTPSAFVREALVYALRRDGIHVRPVQSRVKQTTSKQAAEASA
jgi:predicted transcriptional regulator